MSVEARCAGCGKTYRLQDRFAGKRVKCKECGVVFPVPASATPTPAPVVAASSAPTAEPGPIREPAVAAPLRHRPPRPAVKSPTRARSKVSLIAFCGLALLGLAGFAIYRFARIGVRAHSLPTMKTPAPKFNAAEPAAEESPGDVATSRPTDPRATIDAASLRPVEKLSLPVRSAFPELGEPRVNGQILTYTVQLSEENLGEPMGVRLLMPSAERSPRPLPCILLAPTMSDPLEGETAIDADFDEAAELAKSGFAVAVYDTSRFRPDARPATPGACVAEFMRSDGGLHFARNAINLVLARAPRIDPNRIYSVGYGGAASVALDLALVDPRVRAVALRSPVCDVAAYLGKPGPLESEYKLRGVDAFAARISPIHHVGDVRCPILVMTMDAPSTGGAAAFTAALKAAGKPVTALTLKPSGSGIEARALRVRQLVEWLKAQ